MFTFFTIVFAIVWAVVSFILLFKVWDNIGPIVLSFSKSHIVQLLAMAIIFLIIWGVPGWLWMKIFGRYTRETAFSESAKPRLLRVSGFSFWPKLFFAFLRFC